MFVDMEIVFVKTEERSNFDYLNKVFKKNKVLNGFNKLDEAMIFEPIASDEYEVQNLFFPEEIEADLYVTYPLSVVVKNTIKFNSLHKLIDCIRETYRQIYDEEEKSMTKVEKNENLYNRGSSDGKYGIWGHSIYDLVIEAIRILEGKDRPVVEVYIGS